MASSLKKNPNQLERVIKEALPEKVVSELSFEG